MATIREWLKNENFDFENGRIIVHAVSGNSPGWRHGERQMTNEEVEDILNREFSSGFGGPQCPRFVAEDDEKIYFPSQYDGATGIEYVYKDLSRYEDCKAQTPYPGG